LAQRDPSGAFLGHDASPNAELGTARRARGDRGGARSHRRAAGHRLVVSRGTDIIPLIGTKRRDRLAEALQALDLRLSAEELAAIGAAASQLAILDSER
jgi:aryl-alcohol dehydrogenase-like predicted oxidoreductase